VGTGPQGEKRTGKSTNEYDAWSFMEGQKKKKSIQTIKTSKVDHEKTQRMTLFRGQKLRRKNEF